MIERVKGSIARLERATAGPIARLEQSLPGRFITKWTEDEAGMLAVVIAYYALFSLFPLLLGFSALVGFVVRNVVMQDPQMQDDFLGAITRTFPGDLSDQIKMAVVVASENAGSLGIASLIGVIWSGSGLFGGMEQAFANVYRVPPRGFIVQKLLSIGMMLLFYVLIVVSVLGSSVSTFVASSAAALLPFHVPGWLYFQAWLGWAVAFVSLLALFLAIYWIVPNTRLSFHEVLPGALLAATLFGLSTQIVPIYLRFFGGGYQTYASFGLLLLLMFWFYILGNILVLGAELNAFISRPELARASAAASQPGVEPARPAEKPAALLQEHATSKT